MRPQFADAAGLVCGKSAEDVLQAGIRSAPVHAPRLEQTYDSRGAFAGSLRTARSRARWQSQGHSAHVGQEVEIYYRWHAQYGLRVRLQCSEQRATSEIVHVAVRPGIVIVIVVAAGMLDAASCAGMDLGRSARIDSRACRSASVAVATRASTRLLWCLSHPSRGPR